MDGGHSSTYESNDVVNIVFLKVSNRYLLQ